MEYEDRQQFDSRLWIPPKGEEEIPAQSPWSAESESKAFAAFSAQVTGRVKEGTPVPRDPG